jgi:hypothetical protein
MKNLEKEYEVHRFDIKTSEKKIFKKYTDTIKSHSNFDIRFEENKWNELIKIQEYSIQKIFYMINEYPEEHILFLFLSEYKMPKINKNKKKEISLPTLDTSELNNQLNSSDIRLEISDLESPPSNPELLKESDNPQYICIFSISYFIIAGLLLIHLLQFIFSKEVSNNKFISILIIIFLVYFLFLYIDLFVFNRNFWVYWIFI